MKRRKGFTLIELMIVLAVIAILAAVLVPQTGIFKGQAKNTGVITNINSVRAFLETKTGADFFEGKEAGKESTDLQSAIISAMTVDNEKFVNPIDSSKTAVIVVTADITPTNDNVGQVIVIYNKTGKSYSIYGVNGDLSKTDPITIK